jgi:hypothetical protein
MGTEPHFAREAGLGMECRQLNRNANDAHPLNSMNALASYRQDRGDSFPFAWM